MGVRQAPERAVFLIKNYVADKMPQALIDIRADRADPSANLEAIKKYYTNPVLNPLEFPSIFFLVQSIDYQKASKQANYSSAKISMQVVGVVEDRTSDILTKKIWRYADCVQSILDNVGLISENNKLKIIVYPERCTFSEVYGQKKDSSEAFRQEFTLDLTVECFENF